MPRFARNDKLTFIANQESGQHLRYWTEQALKEGYVVLVPDGLRGLKADCGSPPRISNARLIKDALDAVARRLLRAWSDCQN